MLVDFWRDQRAATAIEYALVASLIAMVIVVTVKLVGTTLSTRYFAPIATTLS